MLNYSHAAANTINADLHCHTTASDGDLRPHELVARAIDQSVDMLAITDHDNIDGYCEAIEENYSNIRLVSGIELSAVWQGINIHIVGLNFIPALLQVAVSRQKKARQARAVKIARRLEKQGIVNALFGAQQFATSSIIGRPQFARYLVSAGLVTTEAEAFRKWLGAGKIGDVKTSWPTVPTVVADIINAGGQAVLAHPHHYKMTNRKLGNFLQQFKDCGGAGIEVCSSGMTKEKTDYFATLCTKYNLFASRGSDFHTPTNPWVELGRVAPIPAHLTPIWHAFSTNHS